MYSPWTPTKEEYSTLFKSLPKYRIDQLWKGLYEESKNISEITALPLNLRSELEEKYKPALTAVTKQESSDSLTTKWLHELPDGKAIETVLMHYDKRSTVCVSSQAGCAMGCGFCATGQAGYERSLEVGEILEQIIIAQNECKLSDRRLSNIVFMGMGEPMANYPKVIASIRRIITDLNIGARNITLSTIGLIPQINSFAEEGLQVGLAVSLHAANDKKRSELIPINKQHPIEKLVEACKNFKTKTNRRVSFEWAMIDGVNDSFEDAIELASITKRAQAHVNLIPLNPTPGWPTKGSSPEAINKFVAILKDKGVNITVRKNRGTDIDAACGQLKSKHQTTSVSLSKKKSNHNS